MTLSESYWQTILHTVPEFISSNTDIFREFLPNQTIFRVHITQYRHREILPNNIDLFRTHIKQHVHFHSSKHFFESFNEHLNRQNHG